MWAGSALDLARLGGAASGTHACGGRLADQGAAALGRNLRSHTLGTDFLSLLAGLVAGFAVLVVSRTPPVAVAFALIAAYLPIAMVRGRARRRRRELAEVWPEAVDNLASAVRAGPVTSRSLDAAGRARA
ncbi:MAG: hypothetical protein WKF73_00810 [Nocardioidaceae bacterium]